MSLPATVQIGTSLGRSFKLTLTLPSLFSAVELVEFFSASGLAAIVVVDVLVSVLVAVSAVLVEVAVLLVVLSLLVAASVPVTVLVLVLVDVLVLSVLLLSAAFSAGVVHADSIAITAEAVTHSLADKLSFKTALLFMILFAAGGLPWRSRVLQAGLIARLVLIHLT